MGKVWKTPQRLTVQGKIACRSRKKHRRKHRDSVGEMWKEEKRGKLTPKAAGAVFRRGYVERKFSMTYLWKSVRKKAPCTEQMIGEISFGRVWKFVSTRVNFPLSTRKNGDFRKRFYADYPQRKRDITCRIGLVENYAEILLTAGIRPVEMGGCRSGGGKYLNVE